MGPHGSDDATTDDPSAEALAALTTQGPLSASVAASLLKRGHAMLDASEYPAAAAAFHRVAGYDDARITAEAWLGLGEALYRLDRDADAVAAWTSVTALPETPSTYRAWRNIAGARVRAADLRGATAAYREAERRAPAEDRAEIATRLGWLAKESGDQGAARRYFARGRGDAMRGLSMAILAVTVVVSFIAMSQPDESLFRLLALDKTALAAGELYRLLSVTLVHDGLLHLGFNMYALYLLGPLVERTWGPKLFLAFYVLTAAAASVVSFVAGPFTAVGASGAIFGLVGVMFAGTRAHHPVLDARSRAIVPQLGTLILINLVFGFMSAGTIDNAAHIGGLISGAWLGWVIPPGRVPTLRTLWRRPDGSPMAGSSPVPIAVGVLVLVGVIAAGLALGGARL